MARDDYYVLVGRILVFLYKRLKGKDKTNPTEYIAPLTDDFPVERDYLEYVIEQMLKQNLIENVNITRAWGGDIVLIDISKIRITPDGIDFLQENSKIRKVLNLIPQAKAIWELFS